MKAKTISTLLAVISFFPMIASAQIVYDNDCLTLTGKFNATTGWSNSNYKSITFNHFGGFYWTFTGQYNGFFQLDISSRSPRLAGYWDSVVFYNTATKTYNKIEVSGIYEHSDARAKTNVKTMGSSLGTLMSLRPVTFNWKQSEKAKAAATADIDPEAGKLHYGFLAQEVEEILPDIVRDSDTGEKLVNYSAMIPMLVEAVQELQQTVEAQARTIEQLSAMQYSSKAAAAPSAKIISCSPNPTSGHVSIETDITDALNAEIIITSMAGNRERLIKVTSATVDFDASTLPAGIHIVSLYVGGQLADTCRLIKQ